MKSGLPPPPGTFPGVSQPPLNTHTPSPATAPPHPKTDLDDIFSNEEKTPQPVSQSATASARGLTGVKAPNGQVSDFPAALKSLALTNADFLIRDTAFEGEALEHTSSDMAHILASTRRQQGRVFDLSPHHAILGMVQERMAQLSVLTQHVARVQSGAHTIDDVLQGCSVLAQQTAAQLRSLPAGETLMVPSGWASAAGGHAIVIGITCHAAKLGSGNTYSVSIYNSGDGLEYHPHRASSTGTKIRHAHVLTIDNVNTQALLTPELFLNGVFQLQCLPLVDTQNKYGAEDIYTRLVPLLEGVEISPQSSEYYTDQRSGSCAWEVLLAVLRHNAPAAYKQIKFEIQLDRLLSYFAQRPADAPYSPTELAVLRATTQKLARSAEKLVASGKMTEAGVQRLMDYLQPILDQLAAADSDAAQKQLLLAKRGMQGLQHPVGNAVVAPPSATKAADIAALPLAKKVPNGLAAPLAVNYPRVTAPSLHDLDARNIGAKLAESRAYCNRCIELQRYDDVKIFFNQLLAALPLPERLDHKIPLWAACDATAATLDIVQMMQDFTTANVQSSGVLPNDVVAYFTGIMLADYLARSVPNSRYSGYLWDWSVDIFDFCGLANACVNGPHVEQLRKLVGYVNSNFLRERREAELIDEGHLYRTDSERGIYIATVDDRWLHKEDANFLLRHLTPETQKRLGGGSSPVEQVKLLASDLGDKDLLPPELKAYGALKKAVFLGKYLTKDALHAEDLPSGARLNLAFVHEHAYTAEPDFRLRLHGDAPVDGQPGFQPSDDAFGTAAIPYQDPKRDYLKKVKPRSTEAEHVLAALQQGDNFADYYRIAAAKDVFGMHAELSLDMHADNLEAFVDPDTQHNFSKIIFGRPRLIPIDTNSNKSDTLLGISLRRSPGFSSRLQSFVARGLERYSTITPQLQPFLYFCKLARHTQTQVASCGLAVTLPNARPMLEQWLAEPRRTASEKTAIYAELVATLRYKPSDDLDDNDVRMLLTAMAYLRSYGLDPPFLDPETDTIVRETIALHGVRLLRYFETAPRTEDLVDMLRIAGIDHHVPSTPWNFNAEGTVASSGPFAINILTGEVFKRGLPIGPIMPESVRQTQAYRALYQDARLPACAQRDHYQIGDDTRLSWNAKSKVTTAHRRLDGVGKGQWFQYLSPESCKALLPAPFTADHLVWRNTASGEPQLIIANLAGEPLYTANVEGGVLQITRLAPPARLLAGFPIPGALLAVESPDNILAWETLPERVVHLELSRFGMSFQRDMEGTLRWRDDPRWSLAADVALPLTAAMPRFDLINAAGERRAVVARCNIDAIISKEDPLALHYQFLPQRKTTSNDQTGQLPQKNQHAMVICNVDFAGRLHVRKAADNIHLATLYLAARDYGNAVRHLRAVSSFEPLSEEDLQEMRGMYLLHLKNKDHSPDSVAVRMQLGLLFENSVMQDYDLARHTEILDKNRGSDTPTFSKALSDTAKAYLDLLQNIDPDLRLSFHEERRLLTFVDGVEPSQVTAGRLKVLKGETNSTRPQRGIPRVASHAAKGESSLNIDSLLRNAARSDVLPSLMHPGASLQREFSALLSKCLSGTDAEREMVLKRLALINEADADTAFLSAVLRAIARHPDVAKQYIAEHNLNLGGYSSNVHALFKWLADHYGAHAEATLAPALLKTEAAAAKSPFKFFMPAVKPRATETRTEPRAAPLNVPTPTLDELEQDIAQLEALANHISDPQVALGQALSQAGGKSTPITMADMQRALIQNNFAALKKQNPTLDTQRLRALHSQLITVLLRKSALQQQEAAKRLSEEIAELTPKSATSGAARELLEQKQRMLVDTQNATRHFDPVKEPALLVFECAADIRLRKDQCETLRSLFEQKADGALVEKILELSMGAGKTKVLMPLVALMQADGKRLSLVIVPASLMRTNREDARRSSDEAFGQAAQVFSFSRQSKIDLGSLRRLREGLEHTIENRDYRITTGESLQAFKLRYFELLNHLSEMPHEIPIYADVLDEMQKILTIFGESVALMDEPDQGLNVRYEVKYAAGRVQPLAKDRVELVAQMYRLLSSYPEVQLAANKQEHLREGYSVVQRKLALAMLQQTPAFASLPAAQLLPYLVGDVDDLPLVRQLYDDPATRETAELLELLHGQLTQILPGCLNSSCGQHYGRSGQADVPMAIYYNKSQPVVGSQFSYQYETLNYTIQMYLYQGVEQGEFTALLQRMQREMTQEADTEGCTLAETRAYQDFARFAQALRADATLGTLNIQDETVVAELLEKVNASTDSKLAFVRDFVASSIGLAEEEFGSNAHDLVDCVGTLRGYTGTPWNSATFHERLSCTPTNASARMVQAVIGDARKCAAAAIPSVQEPVELFAHIDPQGVHAIIDCGAEYKDKTNAQVAQAFQQYFATKSHALPIRAVVYFDDATNQLAIWRIDAAVPQLLGSSDPQVLRDLGLSSDEIFVYYDESHTTGVDIGLPPTARGLVTVGRSSIRRDLEQSMVRMRQIGNAGGQSCTLLVNPELSTSLPELSPQAIYDFTDANQEARLQEDKVRGVRQRIKGNVAQPIFNALKQCKDPTVQVQIFAALKSLYVDPLTDSPFSDFHGAGQQSTESVIHDYANVLVEQLRTARDLLAPTRTRAQRMSRSLGRLFDAKKYPHKPAAVKSTVTHIDTLLAQLTDPARRRQVMQTWTHNMGELPKTTHGHSNARIGSHQHTQQQSQQQQQTQAQTQVQQHVAAYRSKTAVKHDPWNERIKDYELALSLYEPSYCSPQSLAEYKKNVTVAYPAPVALRLNDVLGNAMFDDNFLATENFLKTIQEENFSIGTEFQKPVTTFLVIQDIHDDGTPATRVVLTTLDDAAIIDRVFSITTEKAEQSLNFAKDPIQSQFSDGIMRVERTIRMTSLDETLPDDLTLAVPQRRICLCDANGHVLRTPAFAGTREPFTDATVVADPMVQKALAYVKILNTVHTGELRGNRAQRQFIRDWLRDGGEEREKFLGRFVPELAVM